jgi:hypothetical protein
VQRAHGNHRREEHDAYQSGECRAVREDVCERRDDVDSEADEERADGGVDGPEEGEDDGQEPDGHDDGEPCQRTQEDAAGVVHADHLLPHEVERGARESERDELVDQHQNHRRVAPPGPRQQRERVRVGQQLVAERPVHGRRRGKRQREHVQRRHQVDVLELLRLPHRVHDLAAPKSSRLHQRKLLRKFLHETVSADREQHAMWN